MSTEKLFRIELIVSLSGELNCPWKKVPKLRREKSTGFGASVSVNSSKKLG